jgi:hypothetical protein
MSAQSNLFSDMAMRSLSTLLPCGYLWVYPCQGLLGILPVSSPLKDPNATKESLREKREHHLVLKQGKPKKSIFLCLHFVIISYFIATADISIVQFNIQTHAPCIRTRSEQLVRLSHQTFILCWKYPKPILLVLCKQWDYHYQQLPYCAIEQWKLVPCLTATSIAQPTLALLPYPVFDKHSSILFSMR